MGNHQELLSKRGLYYNLYRLQYDPEYKVAREEDGKELSLSILQMYTWAACYI